MVKNRENNRFYLYLILLFVLLPRLDGLTDTFAETQTEDVAKVIDEPIICPSEYESDFTQTCPENPPPATLPLSLVLSEIEEEISMSTPTCPDYFRWIHEDLKPWKANGITKEVVEAGKGLASFRLVVLDGRVYVETLRKSDYSRDVFTIWGILQLLRVYPGRIPDLDLMFVCDDEPAVLKAKYSSSDSGSGSGSDSDSTLMIPPMFHYCGDEFSYDIPFPDWSFWGWQEIHIKAWEALREELREGNERVKWIDRSPFAFWKGNLHMGRRRTLIHCNSTQDWKALIYAMHWNLETKQGFRESNLADQCTHRYKIYMEGRTWSVSEKYIQACDSMLLQVQPRYYEFFTRSLVPLKHYWPINPSKLCHSIKFAVNWGNNHPQKAQKIGKTGSKFILEDLKMKNIYDYMFHLLSEYGKLIKYKPTVPPGAVEVCLETMICNAFGKERKYKIDSMAKGPSQTGPCTIPPPYEPDELQKFLTLKANIIQNVKGWVASGDIEKVDLTI